MRSAHDHVRLEPRNFSHALHKSILHHEDDRVQQSRRRSVVASPVHCLSPATEKYQVEAQDMLVERGMDHLRDSRTLEVCISVETLAESKSNPRMDGYAASQ